MTSKNNITTKQVGLLNFLQAHSERVWFSIETLQLQAMI